MAIGVSPVARAKACTVSITAAACGSATNKTTVAAQTATLQAQQAVGLPWFVPVPLENFSTDEVLNFLNDQFGFQPDPELSDEELQALFRAIFPSGFVQVPVIEPRKDDYPVLQASLVGDTVVGAPGVGPVTGRRWRLGASYAPDLEASGTLTATASLEYRQYVPLTRRITLASCGTESVGFRCCDRRERSQPSG